MSSTKTNTTFMIFTYDNPGTRVLKYGFLHTVLWIKFLANHTTQILFSGQQPENKRPVIWLCLPFCLVQFWYILLHPKRLLNTKRLNANLSIFLVYFCYSFTCTRGRKHRGQGHRGQKQIVIYSNLPISTTQIIKISKFIIQISQLLD